MVPSPGVERMKSDQVCEPSHRGLTPTPVYAKSLSPTTPPTPPPPRRSLRALAEPRRALCGLARAWRGGGGRAFLGPGWAEPGGRRLGVGVGWGRSPRVCLTSPGLNNRAPLLFVGSKVVRYA